jgi:hypothetical protein
VGCSNSKRIFQVTAMVVMSPEANLGLLNEPPRKSLSDCIRHEASGVPEAPYSRELRQTSSFFGGS